MNLKTYRFPERTRETERKKENQRDRDKEATFKSNFTPNIRKCLLLCSFSRIAFARVSTFLKASLLSKEEKQRKKNSGGERGREG